MLQVAIAHRRCPYDQTAIRNRLGHGLILLRLRKDLQGPDSGAGFAKGGPIGIYQAQRIKPKIAHSPSNGSNVKGISWSNQDNPQAAEFNLRRHGFPIVWQMLDFATLWEEIAGGRESDT
jgi:hypothetical protein